MESKDLVGVCRLLYQIRSSTCFP